MRISFDLGGDHAGRGADHASHGRALAHGLVSHIEAVATGELVDGGGAAGADTGHSDYVRSG